MLSKFLSAFLLMVMASVAAANDFGIDQVTIPSVIGDGATVQMVLDVTRYTGSGSVDVTVPIPGQLTAAAPLPAGCTGTTTLTCTVNPATNGVPVHLTLNVTAVSVGVSQITPSVPPDDNNANNSPVQPFSVIVGGDLQIQKTSPTNTIVNGSSMTFTITPSIAAGGDAIPGGETIRVIDTLPGAVGEFQLTSATGTGWNCSQSGQTVTCDAAGPTSALNPITVIGRVTAAGAGNLTNHASIAVVGTTYIDINPNNNQAAFPFTVTPGTDLAAQVSFPTVGSSSVPISTAKVFRMVYVNNGPQTTTGGTITGVIPSSFSIGALPASCSNLGAGSITASTIVSGVLVRCTTTTVTASGSQQFDIPVTTATAPEIGKFAAQVAPPAGITDPISSNNVAETSYTVVAPYADLSINKVKSPNPVQAGQNISNTLTITNNGVGDAVYSAGSGATPLRVTDQLGSNELYVSVSAGWSCTDLPNNPSAGQHLVSCTKDAGGTLTSGSSTNLILTTQVSGSISGPVTLTNTACTGATALTQLGLTANDGPQPADNNSGNDCSSKSVTGTSRKATITTVKESSADGTTWFDPVATPATIVASNGSMYWRITVSNTSGDTVPTINISDNLPAILNTASPGAGIPAWKTPSPSITIQQTSTGGGTCGAVAAGNNNLTCSFTSFAAGDQIIIVVRVDRPFEAGSFTNTVNVSSPDAIFNGGSVTSDSAAVNVAGQQDVVLTSLAIVQSNPKVGQPIDFTLTARNYGANAANGIATITDTFDPSKYAILSATVGSTNCTINNGTGQVTCPSPSALQRYDFFTADIQVRPIKPAVGTPQYPTETNTATVSIDSASNCEWKVETGTNASLSSACNDAASTSNNSKSINYNIAVPQIDLAVQKTRVVPVGQSNFAYGDPLTFRFRAQNFGPSRAEKVQLVDKLTVPVGYTLNYQSVGNVNGTPPTLGTLDTSKAATVTCSQATGNGDVTCYLDSNQANNFLDPNKEVNFDMTLTYTGPQPTSSLTFANAVCISGDETLNYETNGGCNPPSGNNTASVNATILPKTDLEVVSKTTVTPSPVGINQPIQYAIVIRNNGNGATTKMRLVDVLPANFEWVNGTVGGVDYTPTASAGSFSGLSLAGSPLSCSASPASISAGQSQTVTCDVSGAFPGDPSAQNIVTLTLWARAKAGVFTGPYAVNQTNTATIYPGKDGSGNDLTIDTNPANNSKSATVQVQKASLAGVVFLDRNGNNVQDGTLAVQDEGIGNVTLNLSGNDAFGFPVTATTTSNNVVGPTRGAYLFDDLPLSGASGFTITAVQPAGYLAGPPQPGTGALAAGTGSIPNNSSAQIAGVVLNATHNVGAAFNFPEHQGLTISGYVYLDANDNGNKDGGEIGLPGVQVTLTGYGFGPNGIDDGGAGDDIALTPISTTTDSNGMYQFAVATSGKYTVTEQSAQPQANGVLTARGKTTAGTVSGGYGGTAGVATAVLAEYAGNLPSKISGIVLQSGAGSVNNNFGEIPGASISGKVYVDNNLNNVYDNSEPGIGGVTITLTGTDNLGQTVNQVITTDGTGAYQFSGLRPSDASGYLVTETQPAGWADGADNPGVMTGATTSSPAKNQLRATPVSIGAIGTQFNFGERGGKISGFVYLDINANGVKDASDTGIAGVTVVLTGTDNSGNSISRTVTTGTDGAYLFNAVPPGTYTLTEPNQPTGTINGVTNPGTAGGNATPSTVTPSAISGIVLNPGPGSSSNNFGEYQSSAISGRVFLDVNANAIFDSGDSGLSGVSIVLTGTDVGGHAVNLATTTAADGTYRFDGLVPGTYTVTEPQQPVGTRNGMTISGTLGGTATPITVLPSAIANIVVAGNQEAAQNNFAELQSAKVSGTVFLDLNNNGIQDPNGDVGIANVALVLNGTTASGQAVSMNTVTDAQGHYVFVGLLPGTYTVTEPTQPPATHNGKTVAGTGGGNATDISVTPSVISGITVGNSGDAVNNNFAELPLNIALAVTKTSSEPAFVEGGTYTYQLWGKNNGSDATSGVISIWDVLPLTAPQKWQITAASGDGWTCNVATDATSLRCDTNAVIVSQAVLNSPINVTVHVLDGAKAFSPLRNGVLIRGGGEQNDHDPFGNVNATIGAADVRTLVAGAGECPVDPKAALNSYCVLTKTIKYPVAVSGRVWLDGIGQRNTYESGLDKDYPNWIAEVLDMNNLVVASARTGSDGRYTATGLVPGKAYHVRFKDSDGRSVIVGPVNGEHRQPQTCGSSPTGSDSVSRTPWLDVVLPDGTTSNQVTCQEQSLPIDPSGVIYDSISRQPVPSAIVTFKPEGTCPGYDPNKHVIGYGGYGMYDAQGNPRMTMGSDGFYKFLLSADAPASCLFRLDVEPPSGYQSPSSILPDSGTLQTPVGVGKTFTVEPQSVAPTGNESTLHYYVVRTGSIYNDVINNHLPIDPSGNSQLRIVKTGDHTQAEIGDLVRYTLAVTQWSGPAQADVVVNDVLPPGFRYVPGTTYMDGVKQADPLGGVGPKLRFDLGAYRAGLTHQITYEVRIGVGAQQGSGINTAVANSGSLTSNTATFKVRINGGVFTTDACIVGKIFVDCNGNHVQDPEELGVPGVKLYFSDGSWMVSDSEGKYSVCGMTPTTHVLKVDPLTLPRGSRLTTSSNRNAGDANSLFVDLESGELHRADFIIGSCSNTVLEQVKARRAQGEVRAAEQEPHGKPALKFESKSMRAPAQATDSANQPIVVPRDRGGAPPTNEPVKHDNDIPVPALAPGVAPRAVEAGGQHAQ